jgi:hypothetical protein
MDLQEVGVEWCLRRLFFMLVMLGTGSLTYIDKKGTLRLRLTSPLSNRSTV